MPRVIDRPELLALSPIGEAIFWRRRALAYERAILETLRECSHLADGEDCTLARLKRAIVAEGGEA